MSTNPNDTNNIVTNTAEAEQAARLAEAEALKADAGEMTRIEEARLKLKKLVAGTVAPE